MNFDTNCGSHFHSASASLVSDIPAGDGNVGNLFLQCRLAARYIRQPYAGVNYIPYIETMNLATVFLLIFLLFEAKAV